MPTESVSARPTIRPVSASPAKTNLFAILVLISWPESLLFCLTEPNIFNEVFLKLFS